MKAKFFESSQQELIEVEISSWLRANPKIDIKHVVQSESIDGEYNIVHLGIFYEEEN